MIEVQSKKQCCGCTACANICPKHCIQMKEDEEGFSYPIVDNALCIDCHLCEKVCPVKNKGLSKEIGVSAYACINLDNEVRLDSSSGGIFTLFANQIINDSGVVYGAAFDNEGMVHHICIEKKSDIAMLRGSKYLQSNIGNIYQEVKENLRNNRQVLFTGTPCQNAGLRKYLMKDYDNLFTIDFICHGVPSPIVWKRYISNLKTKYESEICNNLCLKFRSKVTGWIKYSIVVPFCNGTVYVNEHEKDLYMRAFLKDVILRPSCYDCHFKPSTNVSDITLADFWGIQKVLPSMYDDKGTSLCFVNSERGKVLFEKVKVNMQYQEVDFQQAVSYNPAYYQSAKEPKERRLFFEKFNKTDLEGLMQETTRETVFVRSKKTIRRGIRFLQKVKYLLIAR